MNTKTLLNKLFMFVLAQLFLCMVLGLLNIVPVADATSSEEPTSVASNGSQMGYWLGDGSSATSAGLNFPEAVAVDATGNVYIADRDNNRIREVAAVTTIQYGISMTAGNIYTVAGNGTEGNSGDGGPASYAELAEPCGVAVDNAGNIFIADSMNAAVRKVDSKGIITTIAGKGVTAGISTASFSGFSGDGGPATNAELSSSGAVAIDRSGDIFIADTDNFRIREVAAVTAIQYGIPMTAGNIYTVAGDGQGGYLGGYSGDGGPATSAELAQPYCVAVDTSGNIYIADQNNFRIRKVDSKGIITTVAGGGAVQGYTSNSEPATSAGVVPFGLAVDSAGDLYIAGGNCILKLDTATDTITTVASDVNHPGYAGDGGSAAGAGLTATDVAVDASNNLYIVDNNRICKVDNKGIITTVAGDGTANASGKKSAIFTVGQKYYTLGGQSFVMDASPLIYNGCPLVPARYLAEALGAKIAWDTTTQKVTISRTTIGVTVAEMTIGSTTLGSLSARGNTRGTSKTIQMDMAPIIVNGRTYLSAYYVADIFGFNVSWNEAAQTITVSQQFT